MSELKLCPFCGGEADCDEYSHNSVKPNSFIAGCVGINCSVTCYVEGATEEKAIEKWNTRVEDKQE